ncbi:Nitrite reductase [NAD(P)H] small subunit [[Actinomadura] parvosata subsp. kistnae]|uniref:(2Fe-2S)-binding protein n=1 Tax=[Actinomadura] parvosata subsp. kistnae TaxID=1909395 RepID=A0A1V0A4M4_9ACTN|nr:Rieske (2Fe-2S) protein [Nonomuraea sp. ATCC 55076]AQZ65102.1 (2Fe-2S)-binding protein [Nonomuraea sp. ATCC 55076]SPL96380.1 Nitrite reductase [NAD(P)H] small subunit [Actinomadura parvosata subsp. kistnae]
MTTGDVTAVTVHRLGPLDQVPVGEGRAYVVNGVQVAVFRLRGGGVRAVSAVCPHAGGPIADGQIDEAVVVCPLHQHAYDLVTGCSPTGQPPLRTYPVHVDDEGCLVLVTDGTS